MELTGHRIPVDAALESVKAADFVGLVVPGGRAPEYVRMYPQAIAIVKEFFAQGKPVAPICHGPQLLAACEVMNGKKVTSYPACAAECRLAGASWEDAPVVTDGQLVTAQAWPNHPEWLRSFVEKKNAKISI